MRDNQPLLWTGPRRVGTLFYSLARPARRVAGHRASSVIWLYDGGQMSTDPPILDYANQSDTRGVGGACLIIAAAPIVLFKATFPGQGADWSWVFFGVGACWGSLILSFCSSGWSVARSLSGPWPNCAHLAVVINAATITVCLRS